MKCPKCDKTIEEGSNFCVNCGNKINNNDGMPNIFLLIIFILLAFNMIFVMVTFFPAWVVLAVLLLFGKSAQVYFAFVVGGFLYILLSISLFFTVLFKLILSSSKEHILVKKVYKVFKTIVYVATVLLFIFFLVLFLCF